ncbi:MAG: ribosome biogenesis factor YjgA [Candidatus Endonucleobacter bathymodioli]|uniref:Dual-action ribosomal maturation protein DarP n=1 Tax=Candidatus Endonucleibacter bathymodioli TaxID=539814 RepID=A0AA90NM37_9GAMM|nr:ribosome biogenesis factor YjgA [Candidatus Endonucleobacter bathymodioli]
MSSSEPNKSDDLLDSDQIEYISKSEIKREKQALKDMGARLMKIKPSLLEKLPLNERLKEALDESKRITSHNARKRHLSFIGKLMQGQDTGPITELLNQLDSSSNEYNRRFHQLERWRDRLISNDKIALSEYLSNYPCADHQHIRQLVRNASKEAEQGKTSKDARKLFKYLRETDGM